MAEMTAITVRRYPLPPPAPRIRLDTVQQQESARRLVHAAAFAPATHQADLSLATDAVPAVSPALAAPLLQPAATQTGILRTRQLDGEFTNSSSARNSTRSTKRVMVESPAADAITTEACAGLKRKRREGSAEATLFDITVEVQPPSSATDGQGDITGLVGPLDDQAEGAIQRCIPFPYRHLTECLPATPNPERQHSAKIRFSFLDPPPPFSSRRNTASLPTTFPLAQAALAPGRHGAWIIPVSGPLPLPMASSWVSAPDWSSSSTASRLAPPMRKRPTSSSSPPTPIVWTDARLTALWSMLDKLHQRASMGSIRAACFLPSSPSPASSSSSPHEPSWPAHIRVHGQAHLALPLRSLLHIVAGSLSGVEVAKGDGERFLDGGVRLVWVDEEGSAVLAA